MDKHDFYFFGYYGLFLFYFFCYGEDELVVDDLSRAIYQKGWNEG
jgi:hypothetical protein